LAEALHAPTIAMVRRREQFTVAAGHIKTGGASSIFESVSG